jgi:hypothetical protein
MSEEVRSERVSTGRNADLGVWRDNRYVQCFHCGFTCHLDRDQKGIRGSLQGSGATYGEAVNFDDSRITMGDTKVYFDGRYMRDNPPRGCPLCGSLLYWR